MTPRAVLKISFAEDGLTAKAAMVVMTGHACLRTAAAEVLQGARLCDLLPLRRRVGQLMTVNAIKALPSPVRRVAEADGVGACGRRRARVAAEFMTRGARADVAPVRLRIRFVTGVALRVRVQVRGD